MKIRLAVIPPPDDIPSVRSSETSAHPEAVGSGCAGILLPYGFPPLFQ